MPSGDQRPDYAAFGRAVAGLLAGEDDETRPFFRSDIVDLATEHGVLRYVPSVYAYYELVPEGGEHE